MTARYYYGQADCNRCLYEWHTTWGQDEPPLTCPECGSNDTGRLATSEEEAVVDELEAKDC